MVKINGHGTLAKVKDKAGKIRKNVWRYRFSLGKDSNSGKQIYTKWQMYYGTKSQAQVAMKVYASALDGLKAEAETLRFSKYAQLFCEQRKSLGALSAATLRQDTQEVKKLNEYLADTLMIDIDAAKVKELIAFLGRTKTPGGVKRSYRKLYQILDEAVEDNLILRNPCNKRMIPKVKKHEPRYLEQADVSRLMGILNNLEHEASKLEQAKRETRPRKEHHYEQGRAYGTLLRSHIMAVRIALSTGCRRGEVLGLTWGYVDTMANTIKIAQQLTHDDGITAPKTQQSKRIITLDADTFVRLQSWKKKQAEFLLMLGIAQGKDTPVITNELGGWHDPNNFSRWWRAFCKQYGFDGLRFHDLRHTHATLLIGSNVDFKTVQGRLGHTKASTTLDIYASVIPAKDKEAANAVGAILTQPVPVTGEVINL